MKGIYKGAPAKGGPAPGSWGDRYIIEKEEYHGTSMSCNKCVHYCSDDKSCSIEPVYFPIDGWDHWKYCKKLKLSPEYDNEDIQKKIKRFKGEDYLKKENNEKVQMKTFGSNSIIDIKNTEKYNSDWKNKIAEAINYESNLMQIQVINDEIITCDNIINNKRCYKAGELNKATLKKDILERQKNVLSAKNNFLQENYEKILYSIVSAKNEFISNDLDKVRNLLRIIACQNDIKFFNYAVIDNDKLKNLYQMFCELPPVDGRGDDNNGEIDLKSEYKVGTKVLDILTKDIRNLFSIPVENVYTPKITVKFNRQDLAILCSCFEKRPYLATYKNEAGSIIVEVKIKEINCSIKEFKETLAKLVFRKIVNK